MCMHKCSEIKCTLHFNSLSQENVFMNSHNFYRNICFLEFFLDHWVKSLIICKLRRPLTLELPQVVVK